MKANLGEIKRGRWTQLFETIAVKVSVIVGSSQWFVFSIVVVVIWFLSGFFVGFGDSWQLIINTCTTILTFLMMSLLHSSQSKWEKKMEKMQQYEQSRIRNIAQATKRIVDDVEVKN